APAESATASDSRVRRRVDPARLSLDSLRPSPPAPKSRGYFLWNKFRTDFEIIHREPRFSVGPQSVSPIRFLPLHTPVFEGELSPNPGAQRPRCERSDPPAFRGPC